MENPKLAVIIVPTKAQLLRRFPQLLLGLIVIALGLTLTIQAELGVAPWDVLHLGLAKQTGLSYGTVGVLVGLVIMLFWIPLRQRPGVGTISNLLIIGPVVDLFLWLIPIQHNMAARIGFLIFGTLLFGLGAGLYIGASLGAGPRDGLMTGIARRGPRVWIVRTVMEISVLVIGYVLGGPVGVGTALIALGIGPLTHVALNRLEIEVPDPNDAEFPE